MKKMHKFYHSGARPFSKGKDFSKTNYTTCLLIHEENLRNGGIVKSVENIFTKTTAMKRNKFCHSGEKPF